MLPLEVIEEAGRNIADYNGSGMSVMEMSHRSKWYDAINTEALDLVRELMNLPDDYHVIMVQGGASTQFEAIPLNLLKTGKADYIVTGNFAKKAYKEAQKYGDIRLVASSEDKNSLIFPRPLAMISDKTQVTFISPKTTRFSVLNTTLFPTRATYLSLRTCPRA